MDMNCCITVVLICIFAVISEVKHLFACLLAFVDLLSFSLLLLKLMKYSYILAVHFLQNFFNLSILTPNTHHTIPETFNLRA